MCGSLTAHGWIWAILSILTAGAACTGFYWPDWINGPAQFHPVLSQNTTFRFGLFRRCNYIQRNSSSPANAGIYLRKDCGRYEDFNDIPSRYWQAATVLAGVGAGLLVLVALTAFFAMFLEDVCSKSLSYIALFMQVLAAVSWSAAVLVYPFGWDADIIKNEACTQSAGIYDLGQCSIGVAYYIAIGAAVGAYVAAAFSTQARKRRSRKDAYLM